MLPLFRKVYALFGFVLILSSLFALYSDTGSLLSIYVAMVVGDFIFFDYLNYFIAENEPLLAGEISVLKGLIAVFVIGVVATVFGEVYASFFTNIWPGVLTIDGGNILSFSFLTRMFNVVLLYGILSLPAYSIYRILMEVTRSEKMLKEEVENVDFYRYFGFLGFILVFSPFLLFFMELGTLISYLLLLASLVGIYLIIEYFTFRKKGAGLMLLLFNKQYQRFLMFMLISIFSGFLVSIITSTYGYWDVTVPFEQVRILEAPAALSILWSFISWVVIAGMDLIAELEIA